MTSLTYEITEAWMMPDGAKMTFCRDQDGLASTALEFDLETPDGHDWEVKEVRMVEPVHFNAKKVVLAGEMAEDAIGYLKGVHEAAVSFFIANEFVASDDNDQRCDERREMVG